MIFVSAPDATERELRDMQRMISKAIEGTNYKVVLLGKDWKSISKEELIEMLKALPTSQTEKSSH
jgi:hypothetical protein